ncbi:DNA-processing protein DprA [Brooklawnia cerclae]|uniref:DNA processing protein n=1 Tax=Brooklawnia cerclae TaxID=349934 RepID=A0ABX0SJ83_9ACTN|nr:DNA-processing protein DprA [Brooklawnia cerclae]NIH57368.1 DNA processing protein [Brooklawnia cerclae]
MTRWDDQRLARAVLAHVVGPGDPRIGPLVAAHGAVETLAAIRAVAESTWGRRATGIDDHALADRSDAVGLRFLVPGDEEWPGVLSDLDVSEPVGGMGGAPLGLWVRGRGRLDAWVDVSLAVVGARAATPYGEAVATDLSARLSAPEDEAVTILSGGAYGIDAAAHRGALAVGGRTIAVYAGGLDEPYPRGNSRLFEQLACDQLVVSEVPPDVRPTRAGFLARNRLIAALSGGTLVVEAALRSGARNTASWAASLGRVVMAVPGSVHSAMSAGCHRMVTDGQASLVTDAVDVMALLAPLGTVPEPLDRGPDRPLDLVDPRLLRVREALPGGGAVASGEIAARCGLSIADVMGALTELEVLGLVRRDESGMWRLRRPVDRIRG